MANKRFGVVVAFLIFDAALLLIVGAAMWRERPPSADEAVGKGLVTLGSALAIPAFLLLCAFLNAWAKAGPTQAGARSDRDAV